MAHALEYGHRDLLWSYRIRLLVSAILITVGASFLLVSTLMRVIGSCVMLAAMLNSLWTLRMLRLVQSRIVAAQLLGEALLAGDDEKVETAWLTLMYLADPAVGELDPNVPALQKISPFRHLPRRMRYARGH